MSNTAKFDECITRLSSIDGVTIQGHSSNGVITKKFTSTNPTFLPVTIFFVQNQDIIFVSIENTDTADWNTDEYEDISDFIACAESALKGTYDIHKKLLGDVICFPIGNKKLCTKTKSRAIHRIWYK